MVSLTLSVGFYDDFRSVCSIPEGFVFPFSPRFCSDNCSYSYYANSCVVCSCSVEDGSCKSVVCRFKFSSPFVTISRHTLPSINVG